MKTILYILILLCLVYSCHSRIEDKTAMNKLSIAPHIDQNDSLNHKIITTLEKFLSTKDPSWRNNKYWEKSDFKTYIYPCLNIAYQVKSYAPTLLEIVDADSDTQKIVKLAYISHSDTTSENQLDNIYNIVANCKNGKIIFSDYLNFSTKNWRVLKKGSITYKISPYKNINQDEIEQQERDVRELCRFFETTPVPTTYYSCRNPVELFQILGFDYTLQMYMDKSGGIVYPGNHVFSGNNREIYTHEIAHVYIGTSFPHINRILNEGMATLWAGSGEYSYAWHKQNFKKYILENSSTFKAEQYFSVSDRIRAGKETPISKMVGALICDRTLRLYGKSKLFDLFKQKGNIYEIISMVGLNEKNLTEELQKEAMLPPIVL